MNQIKSKNATLIPGNMEGVSGIKLVKEASVFQQNGIYFAVHYGKVIFAYDPKSNKVEADLNCSQTSNRQIRYCLRFFNLDESKIINVHVGSNWNYSGPVGQ